MIVINFGSTGFSGNFHTKSVKLIMSLHYTVHTIMDIIPYIAGNVQLSLCFRRIFLDQFALGICYTVQQRKLVDRTGCSDR